MTREEKIVLLEQIQNREALMREWKILYAAHLGMPAADCPEAMLNDYLAAGLGLPLGIVLTDDQLARAGRSMGWLPPKANQGWKY